MQRFPSRPLPIALLALVIALAACGGSTITSVVSSSPGGSTPTNVSTSTPTTVSPTATPATAPVSCTTLITGGHTASAGASFADVTFPTSSLSGALTPHQVGIGFGWDIYLLNVCSPGTTTSAIHSFYASQLPAHGWAYSPYLPFNGSFEQSCGDAYCWMKDQAPRLIGLEAVMAHPGGAVTYTLRLFTPPSPMPDCGSLVFGGVNEGYTLFYHNLTDIPLPPLTQIGSGHQNVHMQESPLCSTSNAVGDNSFFT